MSCEFYLRKDKNFQSDEEDEEAPAGMGKASICPSNVETYLF